MERAEDASVRRGERAATLDALGLMLDARGGLLLDGTVAGSNFAVLPDWMDRALAVSTL
jgi:hypothetical protein